MCWSQQRTLPQSFDKYWFNLQVKLPVFLSLLPKFTVSKQLRIILIMIKLPQALISLLSFCDQMVWITVSISNCFSFLMTPKYSTLWLHFHWLLWFHILYLMWHHLGSTSTSQIRIWKPGCTGLCWKSRSTYAAFPQVRQLECRNVCIKSRFCCRSGVHMQVQTTSS